MLEKCFIDASALFKYENQRNAFALRRIKIDNFLGFEELSKDEHKDLDSIEAEMEKGEKYKLE
ncbi:MAG: hypothetical protein QXN34_07355 [Archaeoglobaceae archaeon]